FPRSETLNFEEVGPRQQMLGDQVVWLRGGLAIALDQQLAVRPEQRQAAVRPRSVNLRGQTARLAQGDFIKVVRGKRARGGGQMVRIKNKRDGWLEPTA